MAIPKSFEPNNIYNLRVFGYSRGGNGKMSSPLIQFTIGKSLNRLGFPTLSS